MADVIVDGVKIEFRDPQPASFSEARARLEEMLAEDRRVLAGLWFDGQPFDESFGNNAFMSARRVEAASLTLEAALTQAGAALVPEFSARRNEADALASAVLRRPWRDVQPRCVQVLEATGQLMQQAVDLAALGGDGSPLGLAVTQLAEAVERWMNGVQRGDAAEVCLALDQGVVPAFARVIAVLEGPRTP